MELLKIRGNTYYFDNPTIVGLYHFEDDGVCLVDTGLDDDGARKILRLVREEGWFIKAVINTHSHADHCGGNQFIQKRSQAVFYATAVEKSYIETPSTEPHYLFGAYPPKVLRNKFLQARPSTIQEVLEPGPLTIQGETFEIVDLKGHSPGMVGVKTPDGVFFLADALIDKAITKKYGTLYHYHLKDLFRAFETLRAVEAEAFVLSHGGLVEDLEAVIAANDEALRAFNQFLVASLKVPKSKEALHREMVRAYHMKEAVSNYFLNDSLLASHLSYLIEEGDVVFRVEEGGVLYEAVAQ